MTLKWQGKPLFVRNRTAEEIATVRATDMSLLPDPEKDEVGTAFYCNAVGYFRLLLQNIVSSPRTPWKSAANSAHANHHHYQDRVESGRDNWLVVLGICTHLGCVPLSHSGDYNGYFCPCHGSHYDASGRIRKGPAPLNLAKPPYKCVYDQRTAEDGSENRGQKNENGSTRC